MVDDEDYEYLNQWKWYYRNTGYASRTINSNISIAMHRIIMNTPKGMTTDHINGNRLDNRKSNLRIATYAQNQMNKKSLPNSSSKYKGVTFGKHLISKPWMAMIKISGKSKTIGYFKTEIEAALAYNEYAKKYFKQFAFLNKIN